MPIYERDIMPQRQFTYDKYLTAPPTPLMQHLEQWIKDKTGFDPSDARTKADAFSMGLRLTVALRGYHQESEENQTRLAANRRAANERDAAAIARREKRLEMGISSRGRLPKNVVEEPEPAAPAKPKRGRPKKTAEPTLEPVAAEEPAAKPRRTRARKATASAEQPTATVTPIRRRAAKPAAAPAEDAAPAATKPVRRRPVRRSGEAGF